MICKINSEVIFFAREIEMIDFWKIKLKQVCDAIMKQ